MLIHSIISNSVAPWTVACQTPLPMGVSRQEYWSRLPFPTPGDLPNPEIEPVSLASPALSGEFFTTATPGKPQSIMQRKCNSSKTVLAAPSSCMFPSFPSPLSHFAPIPELAFDKDKEVWTARRRNRQGNGNLCWVMSGPRPPVGLPLSVRVGITQTPRSQFLLYNYWYEPCHRMGHAPQAHFRLVVWNSGNIILREKWMLWLVSLLNLCYNWLLGPRAWKPECVGCRRRKLLCLQCVCAC